MHRKLLMSALAATLGLAILPSVGAAQLFASAADDDIPGVALPLPPRVISDTLQAQAIETSPSAAGTDIDDVYAVSVKTGQTFWAVLDGAVGTDFDLLLFGANATSVAGDTPGLGKSENIGTSFEFLKMTATKDQTAYLDAYAFDGAGAYTLDYGFGTKEATISVTASATPAYGGPAVVRGSVLAESGGTPIEGMKVYLLEKPYGAASYKKTASVSVNAAGEFLFNVKPVKSTQYQVMGFGYGSYFVDNQPAAVKIVPRASLTTPTVASPMRAYRSYSVSGYLKPYDPAHTRSVKIRAYKWDGKQWVWKKTVVATNYKYDSSTVKYKAWISLPRGYWRIRAYADAPYAGTKMYSSAWAPASRYRTIR